MKIQRRLSAAVLASLLAMPVWAQTTAADVQRDAAQQQRIENGLKSGQLSSGEAARLEHGEARVDHLEAHDMKDGSLSAADQAQIRAAQNRESRGIAADKHNGITGNPNSASSSRMQADVQRNVNQQQRIQNGVASGALNNQQVGALERGQKHVDNAEGRAGRNGHVSAGEQGSIQERENVQSRRIHNKKTD